jgi:FkbM family methyltransferase
MIVGFEDYKHEYDFKVTGVIHVGAHYGQEYEDYIKNFGEGIKTHWFEPLEEPYNKLVEKLSHDTNAKTYKLALGDEIGTATIHVDSGNEGQSSSLLKPAMHREIFQHITFENTETVDVARLDDFNITDCNVLALDVQGNELAVLEGGRKTLENIDYVFTEFNTVEMYEGCPSLDDLDALLIPLGFERVQTWYTQHHWGDAFYLKR